MSCWNCRTASDQWWKTHYMIIGKKDAFRTLAWDSWNLCKIPCSTKDSFWANHFLVLCLCEKRIIVLPSVRYYTDKYGQDFQVLTVIKATWVLKLERCYRTYYNALQGKIKIRMHYRLPQALSWNCFSKSFYWPLLGHSWEAVSYLPSPWSVSSLQHCELLYLAVLEILLSLLLWLCTFQVLFLLKSLF